MISLAGRVAIVTGGGGGMGVEIASILAEAGARVALADVRLDAAKSLVEELNRGGKQVASAFKCDVSKRSDIDDLMRGVLAGFGRMDILVNGAGVLSATPIDATTDQEWNRIMEINLKGVFECCRAGMAEMKKRRYGKIVNIGSAAGKVGGIAASVAYSTSKAGVHSLTKTFAKAGAPYGINVNCIAPGPTATAMLDAFTPEQLEAFLKSIPLGRFGKPRDIAGTVLFLASDLSDYVTGQVINVNGGMLMD